MRLKVKYAQTVRKVSFSEIQSGVASGQHWNLDIFLTVIYVKTIWENIYLELQETAYVQYMGDSVFIFMVNTGTFRGTMYVGQETCIVIVRRLFSWQLEMNEIRVI